MLYNDIRFVEIGDDEKSVRELFTRTDTDFNYYLGYEDGVDSAVDEIINSNSHHKYWLVYNSDELVGLVYVYDYQPKYHKCSIGYGLLPKFRGQQLSLIILNKFVYLIELTLGVHRIQADIELTNKYCLDMFEKLKDELGFIYECTAKIIGV